MDRFEKRNKEYNPETRKLCLTISSEVWGIIFSKNDLDRIDELVTQLLCEHYNVEINAK